MSEDGMAELDENTKAEIAALAALAEPDNVVRPSVFNPAANSVFNRPNRRSVLGAGDQSPPGQTGSAATSNAPTPGILADVRWYGEGEKLEPVNWLFKNILPAIGKGLMPGQWGGGKTYVALDLGNSVARGIAFANYMCKRPGGVFYLAPDGGAFIPIRLRALQEKYKLDCKPLPFAWLDWCPPLAEQKAPAFSLLDLCKAVAEEMPKRRRVPLVLIIIDTLSAAHNFKDANDAAEAQRIMNYLDAISKATGAFVLAVDHYGKDLEAGTRGSSAKEASADAVLAVLGERSQAGVVSKTRIAIRKARGGAQGAETHFTLPVTQLGLDGDGEPITSCTVEWSTVTVAAPENTRRDRWSKTADRIRAPLVTALAKRGIDRCPFPDHPNEVRHAVALEEVREEFHRGEPANTAQEKEARKKAFKRGWEAARDEGHIYIREVNGEHVVWLARGTLGHG
jgi:hypothetical protein